MQLDYIDLELWIMSKVIEHDLIFCDLLTKYVDSQWIENFYMFAKTFFDGTNKMKPFISKIDTRYCLENWYVLPYVKGAIDGTHISISKPNIPFVKDYYFH